MAGADNPLAQGFNILDGRVEVTVPNVPTRDDYAIVREYSLHSAFSQHF
jgi:hypothetical protein